MEQLGIGFLVWYGTGVDDLIVLIGFVLACTSRNQKISVGLGTMLGVVIMLALSLLPLLLAEWKLPMEEVKQWMPLAGFIPVYMGVKTLLQALRPNGDNDGDGEVRSRNGFFLTAMLTYLGNATDDWLVMTNLFVSATQPERWLLAAGDLVGCISSILSAAVLSRVLHHHKNRMRVVAGVILILIGVRILIG